MTFELRTAITPSTGLRAAMTTTVELASVTEGQVLARLAGYQSADIDDRTVTLEYVDASTRYVWTPLDGHLRWMRWGLGLNASGFWTLGASNAMDLIKGVDNDDAGITYGGAGWGTSASGNMLGGEAAVAKGAGKYAEFDVTGTERIYLVVTKRSICGVNYVTIDGAATLVNELPLVGANRVLDGYSTDLANNQRVLIASGLTPATTYTVRVTTSGTTSGTDTYIYFEGYGTDADSREDAGTVTNAAKNDVASLMINDAGYAYYYKPTGATGSELTGTDHENEAIATVAWQDGDEADVAVSAGDTLNTAAQINLVQTGYARHSETGATNNAGIASTYAFDYRGCHMTVAHTLLVAASVSAAYDGMLPSATICNRGYIVGGTRVPFALTGDDATFYGLQRSRLGVMWGTTHDYALALYAPDISTLEAWAYSTDYCYIEDRVGGTNKIFLESISAARSMSIGDVLQIDAWFRAFYCPGFTP